MIPKIIHYCWFGGNPMPKLADRCIESWKKFCQDYQIIEWNEENYDLSQAPLYVRQAYERKKWAFVTDYVRLQVVYENGGIYLDTDVELLKSLDPLRNHRAYFGFEDGKTVNTGLGFGAEKGSRILEDLMAQYREIEFLREDGSCDTTPCPQRNTQVFLTYGLQQDNSRQELPGDILILPSDVLCPIEDATKRMRKTKNTVSIHWFSGSWYTEEDWKAKRKNIWKNRLHWIGRLPNRIGTAVLGEKRYSKVRGLIKGTWRKLLGKTVR